MANEIIVNPISYKRYKNMPGKEIALTPTENQQSCFACTRAEKPCECKWKFCTRHLDHLAYTCQQLCKDIINPCVE